MKNAEFLFHIIPSSGVPIYRQLLDQIRTLIASGRLEAGAFLPSIRQVGSELEINPMTVSKVYSILEREGWLENVRGQGMRVVNIENRGREALDRKKVILPLIHQVVSLAQQLSLTVQDITEIMQDAWKERDHE